ncbi:MAG: hydantoinase/oxoprolinase family protein [Actinomycetota bacterium]|nr:hydantoinase/oxoprolinase family protein [Actinomycetota bacterium]
MTGAGPARSGTAGVGAESWIVGIDIGGTFTDAIATGRDGRVRVAKVPSTPEDPGLAFERALLALAEAGISPGAIRMIFHGTTVATNALLTGRTGRVALATTAGFRDVLGYRNGSRPAVYDLTQPRPRQLVRRRDRIEVAERLSGLGAVVTPLTEQEADRVAAQIAAREPEAVAVCLLFSYLDDAHERMLGEAIARRLPGVPVTLSSAVAREFREYPRTSTAVINAGLRPVVGSYLLRLRSRVRAVGAPARLQIMQSNGGCLPADRAAEQAHRLVLSGPAAGVAGTVALGAGYGLRQLISLDMGGTSLDICLIGDGVPPVTPRQEIDGSPILAPSVDIVTVGAGGGSIAAVDRGGRLRVGPESAGARPGPAAYGHGGDRATLTDAHVVAGTLPADMPLAGSLALDRDAAAAVLAPVAADLGLSVPDAADGIIRLAVAQMTAALRQVSVQRGLDPREYTLVAFGGAGPLHAGLLLREMGFGSVLVPRFPGLFAASGLTSTDIRLDESRTVLAPLTPGLVPDLASWYAATGRRLSGQLRRDGIPASQIRLVASADCRFVGQGYELSVPVTPRGSAGVAALARRFVEQHRRRYGHADPGQRVEVVNVRLSAFGALADGAGRAGVAAPAGVGLDGAGPAGRRRPPARSRIGQVSVRLPGAAAARAVPVFDREHLGAGVVLTGPAIVHQLDTTTLVLAGQRARFDDRGSMWLEEGG